MHEYAELIAEKIRIASHANVRQRLFSREAEPTDGNPPLSGHGLFATNEKVIMIGASTGGTETIKNFLVQMPPDSPGILITQHMPPGFTRSFADRLDKLCRIKVKEAEGGERILPGHAFVAPGHSHLQLTRSGINYLTRLDDGPPINHHRPSVDALFRSAASSAGKNAVGVILTGMGKDGAAGMLEMKKAGAYNFAQDESSCVVFGMPREAIAMGATHEVAPLHELPRRVMEFFAAQGNRASRV
jgi:two-component system chemotaxis response regulator CheB